jgi:hypothetical protein
MKNIFLILFLFFAKNLLAQEKIKWQKLSFLKFTYQENADAPVLHTYNK